MRNLSLTFQRWIEQIFCLLVFFLPFIFVWINDELFEFNKMLVVYATTAIVTGLFLGRMILERRLLWQTTIFDWPVWLFLLSQAIATALSMHPRTSLLGYYTRLNGGLLSIMCYTLLYYAFVNNVRPAYRTRFITMMFTSSIFVSLYAIGEHFGHSMSCLMIKGKFDVACWVQDVQSRVFATFGQPNWLAAYNVTLIGLGASLMLLPKKIPWREQAPWRIYLIGGAVYLNYLALIFTKSRSGIIGCWLSLIIIAGLSLLFWQRRKILTKRRLQKLVLVGLGFLLPMLIWGTPYTPSITAIFKNVQAQTPQATQAAVLPASSDDRDLYTPIPYTPPASLAGVDFAITDSADIRKIVWRGALEIWRTHPFIGTGTESFAYSYYAYRPIEHNWTSEWDFLYNKAHNELLNLAANTGSFGLLTYLSIFLVLAFCVIKLLVFNAKEKKIRSERAQHLIGLGAGLLALSVTNFFGFSTVMVQVLLYLYLAIVAIYYQKIVLPEAKVFSENKFWPKIFLGAVIVGTAFFVYQTYRTWYADYLYASCKSNLSRQANNFAQALANCELAVRLRPQEAVYQIELADYLAQYVAAAAKQNAAGEAIDDLAEQALTLSNNGLALNNANLNFYKTRFRTLTNLATHNVQLLSLARETLEAAIERSPTDPKLRYYYYSLLKAMGQSEAALLSLHQAVELRPIYYEARLASANEAVAQGNYAEALAHYHFLLDHVLVGGETTVTIQAAAASAAASLRSQL